jgi:hypothetical protein
LNFNYKRFYLNLFTIGSVGNDLYNANRFSTDFLRSYENVSTTALQAWGMPGVIDRLAKLPQIVQNPPGIETNPSSYFVEDGSYLRLSQLIFGYDFKVSTWNSLEQFRLFFQANNLFTITNYSGIDPVIPEWQTLVRGVDNGHYPNVRSFMLGLKITY